MPHEAHTNEGRPPVASRTEGAIEPTPSAAFETCSTAATAAKEMTISAASLAVALCVLGAFLAWMFGRATRTGQAINILFNKPCVLEVMTARMRPDYLERTGSPEGWNEHVRKVLYPACCEIERFAALANRNFPCTRLGSIYSLGLVRDCCREQLIGIWRDEHTRHFVKHMRDHEPAQQPETLFCEFEHLVAWLTMNPIKRRRTP